MFLLFWVALIGRLWKTHLMNVSQGMSIDGVVEDCSIAIANVLEIPPSCTKPSIYSYTGRKLYVSTAGSFVCAGNCPISCVERDNTLTVSYVDFPNARFIKYSEERFGYEEDYIRHDISCVVTMCFFESFIALITHP